MKRTFIALQVKPGNRLLDAVSNLREGLATDHIKWVDMNKVHITLAFLGDIDDEKILIVSGLIDSISAETMEFSFKISGLGVFRNLRDPRVIWAGIDDTDNLGMFYNRLTPELKQIGFAIEDRPFRPHLTVGRVKSIRNISLLEKIIERYRDNLFQTVPVKEIILYESILDSSGPTYIPLHKGTLQSD